MVKSVFIYLIYPHCSWIELNWSILFTRRHSSADFETTQVNCFPSVMWCFGLLIVPRLTLIPNVWEMLEGFVPNLTDRSQIVVKSGKSMRRFGRTYVIPPVATGTTNRLQRLREESFCVKGPMLFNSLPSHLRKIHIKSRCQFYYFGCEISHLASS